MIDIDATTILEAMRAVVEREGPSSRYDRLEDLNEECVYVLGTDIVEEDYDNNGCPVHIEVGTGAMRPGCIVGHVLHDLGVPLQAFLELNINRGSGVPTALSKLANRGYVGNYDDVALGILSQAQFAQDEGDDWGSALRAAEEAYSAHVSQGQ